MPRNMGVHPFLMPRNMGGQDVFHALQHLGFAAREMAEAGLLDLRAFFVCSAVQHEVPTKKMGAQPAAFSYTFISRFQDIPARNCTGRESHPFAFVSFPDHRSTSNLYRHRKWKMAVDNTVRPRAVENGRPRTGRPFAFVIFPRSQALMRIRSKACISWNSWLITRYDPSKDKAKKLFWVSHEEVLKLAQKCEVVDSSESTDLFLAYLHDKACVVHFADDPSFWAVVNLDPTNFFLEPVPGIIVVHRYVITHQRHPGARESCPETTASTGSSAPRFRANAINCPTLLELTDEDLEKDFLIYHYPKVSQTVKQALGDMKAKN
eukprot:g63899.t1